MGLATLRGRLRHVQELENAAADKAGVACLLLDEAQLIGPGAGEYLAGWIERQLGAIGPEVLEAAQVGAELSSEVNG